MIKSSEARSVILRRTRTVEAQMKPLPVEGQPLREHVDHDDLICWLAYKEAKALLFTELDPGN
jgi:hypothetical protein